MSFGTINRKSTLSNFQTGGKILKNNYTYPPTAWIRSPSWVSLPTVVNTDQKFVGLIAVYPDSNYVALTAAGAYNIDFGDGSTSQNIATGVQVNYAISYSASGIANTECPVTFTASTSLVTRTAHGYTNGMAVQFWNIATTTGINVGQTYYVISATSNTFQFSTTVGGSASTFTSDGTGSLLPYRQAVVTITPQAGQNLTALNLNIKHTATGLQSGYNSQWLDITVSMPNCSSSGLIINGNGANIYHAMLEQVNVINAGGMTNSLYQFFNCQKLQSVPNYYSPSCTSTGNMFQGCTALTSVGTMTFGAVTSASSMFSGCFGLISAPYFNTSACTTMNSMFNNCYALRNVPTYDTHLVTDMSSMFNACYDLQNVPLFNTVAVTSMPNMFSNCGTLTQVPLFNTAAVTSMSSMFYGASSLVTVPLFNTVLCQNMGSMFTNCYALQSVPLFNTGACTNTSGMFQSCVSLTTVPLFDTHAVTSASSMFNSCVSLESVPAFNFAACTNLGSLFQSCTSLQSVGAMNTPLNTAVGNMYLWCYSLTTIPYMDTSRVTSHSGMFQSCTSLLTVPPMITANSTNMSSMFNGCQSLLYVPQMSTSNVTTMSSMLNGCRSIQSFPTMNCASVTAGNYPFNGLPNMAASGATSVKFTHSYSGNKLSNTAINTIFTNLPSVSAQTITILGNPGGGTCNTTIATSKGWTVN